MNYKDDRIGYSFDLPDSWELSKNLVNLSAPSRFFRSGDRLVEVAAGEVEDHSIELEARRSGFLKDIHSTGGKNPSFLESGKTLGTESNTLAAVFDVGDHKEFMISAVRERIIYIVRYSGRLDSEGEVAI